MQGFFEHFKLLAQKIDCSSADTMSSEAIVIFLKFETEQIALLIGKKEFFCLYDFIQQTGKQWVVIDNFDLNFNSAVYISSFLYHQKEILYRKENQLHTLCQSRLTALVELKHFIVFQSHVFSWPKKHDQVMQSLLPHRVIARIEENLEVPPLPETTEKLLALKNTSSPSLVQFLAIVEKDPILLAQVIKWARSPFYGYRRDVATAREAITRVLGIDIALNLALSLSLKKPFFWPQVGISGYQEFHERSLLLAEISLYISRERQLPLDENYLALGALLADFGYYILAHCFTPYYNLLSQEESLGLNLDPCLREFHLLEFTHQHLGAWVLSKWQFPVEVLATVQWHHHAQPPISHHLYPQTVLLGRYLLSQYSFSDEYKTAKELQVLTNFFGPFERWERSVEKIFFEQSKEFSLNSYPLWEKKTSSYKKSL